MVGGCSRLPGFIGRLHRRLSEHSDGCKVTIKALDAVPEGDGAPSVWKGAAALAAAVERQRMWVSRGEMQQLGAEAARNKREL